MRHAGMLAYATRGITMAPARLISCELPLCTKLRHDDAIRFSRVLDGVYHASFKITSAHYRHAAPSTTSLRQRDALADLTKRVAWASRHQAIMMLKRRGKMCRVLHFYSERRPVKGRIGSPSKSLRH